MCWRSPDYAFQKGVLGGHEAPSACRHSARRSMQSSNAQPQISFATLLLIIIFEQFASGVLSVCSTVCLRTPPPCIFSAFVLWLCVPGLRRRRRRRRVLLRNGCKQNIDKTLKRFGLWERTDRWTEAQRKSWNKLKTTKSIVDHVEMSNCFVHSLQNEK